MSRHCACLSSAETDMLKHGEEVPKQLKEALDIAAASMLCYNHSKTVCLHSSVLL